MEFHTRIAFPKSAFDFSHAESILLIGSCFAENIGKRLDENKFDVDINPFGTLYNPASVAAAIRMLLNPTLFTTADLFEHEGMHHSFAHHSRFSALSEKECLEKINQRLIASAKHLTNATRLVVTFGSAFVYRLKSTGKVVSNCHKLPENRFERQRMSVAEITNEWKPLLLTLSQVNPNLKVLFTISPIRHWKDGAHENQLSKSTLLLAVEELRKEFGGQTGYFPAYEIMMDELRDYRFYADDMLHPSPLAIDYIWQRFADNYLSPDTRALLKEWAEIQKAINHKPFQPNSEAHQKFIRQTLLKLERISRKAPSFDIAAEREELLRKSETYIRRLREETDP